VVVAVADGARLERGEVGAGPRLGVADAEDELPLEDARQQRRLLRRGAELHDRRPDGVDGDDVQRRPRAIGLVPEDELLERRAALAAVLLRPADAEPAVGAHAADDVPVDGPAALVPLGVERRPELWGEQVAIVGADLAAERVLLRR